MKSFHQKLLAICIMASASSSCQTSEQLRLAPPSDAPVYMIKVDDATEVGLLSQRFHLDVIKVKLPNVYFHASTAQKDSIALVGYGQVTQTDPGDVYTLYGKLTGTVKESDITAAGVAIVNREQDHIIVTGTIANLTRLKAKGYTLLQPGYEFRPREIEAKVKDQPSIQRAYDLGVDIFSVERTKDSAYLIHGSAFDMQIDSMKNLHYEVKIIRQKI